MIDKGLTAGALGITAKISNYPGVPGPVSGNNDEALEEALFLTKFASNVDLVVPTPALKAREALAEEALANLL